VKNGHENALEYFNTTREQNHSKCSCKYKYLRNLKPEKSQNKLTPQTNSAMVKQLKNNNKEILELRTLRESSSKGFSDTIYNDMNSSNTKLLKS